MRNYSQPREIFRAPTSVSPLDPLARSPWSQPSTVAGFSRSLPNAELLQYARRLETTRRLRVLDIGCGAGRNTVPLAQAGYSVTGIDLSWPMLAAASERGADRLRVVCAPMDALPVRDRGFDLIVAHGIWNLARSGREFRDSSLIPICRCVNSTFHLRARCAATRR